MTRYLITFDDGAMDHVPADELPGVGDDAHAVMAAAKESGVWVFGGGVVREPATVVSVDGTAADGPLPYAKAVVGGFAIVDVASREDAVGWAARWARACRCPQEVREIMHDPLV